MLEKLPLYQCASAAAKKKMMKYAAVHHCKKREYLFRIRDRVEQIYLIASGYAVAERDGQDHGTKSVFLLHEGDLINEVILDHATASISCYTLSEAEVVTFPKNEFLELMKEDFAVAKYVIDSMALKIRKLYHQVERSTKPTLLNRQVSSRLWKFGRDYGIFKDGVTEIPFEIRITFLATFVGSNRETVSRIIKKMSEKDILTIKNGVCRIYDMNALKDFSK